MPNALRSFEPILSVNAHQLVDLSVLVAGVAFESIMSPELISKVAVAGFHHLKTLTFDNFEHLCRPKRSESSFCRKIVDGAPNLEAFHVQQFQFDDPHDRLDVIVVLCSFFYMAQYSFFSYSSSLNIGASSANNVNAMFW